MLDAEVPGHCQEQLMNTLIVPLLNKENSFQIILPSDVIIALRFVFVSARSDKMQQQSGLKNQEELHSAHLSTDSAKGGRQ